MTVDFKNFFGNGNSENVTTVRSYATEEGLMKGLKKFGFDEDRFLVVKTLENRYTAIFSVSNFSNGGYIGLYSSKGFMTM